jgi:hypothetical protein
VGKTLYKDYFSRHIGTNEDVLKSMSDYERVQCLRLHNIIDGDDRPLKEKWMKYSAYVLYYMVHSVNDKLDKVFGTRETPFRWRKKGPPSETTKRMVACTLAHHIGVPYDTFVDELKRKRGVIFRKEQFGAATIAFVNVVGAELAKNSPGWDRFTYDPNVEGIRKNMFDRPICLRRGDTVTYPVHVVGSSMCGMFCFLIPGAIEMGRLPEGEFDTFTECTPAAKYATYGQVVQKAKEVYNRVTGSTTWPKGTHLADMFDEDTGEKLMPAYIDLCGTYLKNCVPEDAFPTPVFALWTHDMYFYFISRSYCEAIVGSVFRADYCGKIVIYLKELIPLATGTITEEEEEEYWEKDLDEMFNTSEQHDPDMNALMHDLGVLEEMLGGGLDGSSRGEIKEEIDRKKKEITEKHNGKSAMKRIRRDHASIFNIEGRGKLSYEELIKHFSSDEAVRVEARVQASLCHMMDHISFMTKPIPPTNQSMVCTNLTAELFDE